MALIEVAEEILKSDPIFNEGNELFNEQLVSSLSTLCKEIHLSATEQAVKFETCLKRKVYTTPKSYLDLIYLYLHLFKSKRQELNANKIRLANGLHKLEQANKQVADL